MAKIKICGITSLKEIAFINRLKPDYIGFVFADSRRKIDYNTAKLLKAELNKDIETVGVFVNEDIDYIKRLCDDEVIDLIQLHGDEDNEYIERLRQNTESAVIKAVRVKGAESVSMASKFTCDYILFDSCSAKGRGGTGEGFDYSLLKSYNKDFFLAGGLNCVNAAVVTELLNPFCVDVSSGVETDGMKDESKVSNFIEKIRSVE